jgi:hypothetical protein
LSLENVFSVLSISLSSLSQCVVSSEICMGNTCRREEVEEKEEFADTEEEEEEEEEEDMVAVT